MTDSPHSCPREKLRMEPRSVALSHELFHLYFRPHPRMDAALKKMFTFRKACHLKLAALQDSCLGYRHFRKAASTLGNYFFSWRIERRYEAATELRNFCEGMRLAALIDCINRGSFLHCERVRLEVPVWVGCSGSCLCKQVGKRRGCSKCDVSTEVRTNRVRGIEGGWIAFVQGHDLCRTKT